jgi:predicted GIY-YIG superfamily endonuclease
MKGMNAEIKEMERSLKPKDPGDSAGYIYVIKASPEKDSVYKIGRTKDLTKRLATYSTGHVDGIDILYKFRTDSHKKTEACIKLALKERQMRKFKEVYQVDIDMIKTVILRCDEAMNYTRVYSNAKADKMMKGGYYVVLEKDE